MNAIYIAYIALLAGLLKPKTSRLAAMVIIIAYAVYALVIIGLPGEYYYHAAALLNLIVGCALFPRYKLVALLSFTLIIVNNIGFVIYELNELPTLYNTLALTIILIQISLLYMRILIDEHIARRAGGRAILWFVNIDSFEMGSTTLSTKKTKED